MFGGILEVTKESDEIYIYHIPTKSWKLIDMGAGPMNLDAAFKKAADRNPALSVQLKMNHSSPNIHHAGSAELQGQLNKSMGGGLEPGEMQTIDVAGKGSKIIPNINLKRTAHSLPRMGMTSYTARFR